MPKTRHLLITIGIDKKTREGVRVEVDYRRHLKKEKFLGEFCASDKNGILSKKGDGFAAAFLDYTVLKGEPHNQIFLRRCLQWLVDGTKTNNDRSRKISFLCHGDGTTKVHDHAKVGFEMREIMKCICNAGLPIDRNMHASATWDGDKPHCTRCNEKFIKKFLKKSGRHHCRICGKSVCEDCCTKETVSCGIERKGRAAASAPSSTSWVCKDCSNQEQNLLSKVGVFRLLVCYGALRRISCTGHYVTPSRVSQIRDVPVEDERKYREKNYKLFPKGITRPIFWGLKPDTIEEAIQKEVGIENYREADRLSKLKVNMSGRQVPDYLERTVAHTVVKSLRHYNLRGMKVTAARGTIMSNSNGAATVVVDQKKGVWRNVEYDTTIAKNKQLYDLNLVEQIGDKYQYGSHREVPFSEDKFFCIT